MKKLWLAFAVVLGFSFAVLGWVGTRSYQEAPPLPEKVVTPDGTAVLHAGGQMPLFHGLLTSQSLRWLIP